MCLGQLEAFPVGEPLGFGDFLSEYDRIDLLQAQSDDVEFADKRLQLDEILRVEFRYPVEHTKIVVQ